MELGVPDVVQSAFLEHELQFLGHYKGVHVWGSAHSSGARPQSQRAVGCEQSRPGSLRLSAQAHAAQQLVDGNLPVADLAQPLGPVSQRHFKYPAAGDLAYYELVAVA